MARITESNNSSNVFIAGMVLLLVVLFLYSFLADNTASVAESSVLAGERSGNDSELVLLDLGGTTILNTIGSKEYFEIDSNTVNARNRTWLEFDGSNDLVTFLGTADNKISHNYSFSIWINSTRKILKDEIVIFHGNTDEGLHVINGILTYFKDNSTGDLNSISYVTDINDSLWHHVVITQNQSFSNISMWVDGVLVNLTDVGITKSLRGTLIRFSWSTLNFQGSVDEFRLYNKTLSITEISEIYNSGRAPNSSLPVSELSYWIPFNENSGIDIYSLNQTLFPTIYPSAIDGATWANDGVDVLLIEDTDYTLSSDARFENLYFPYSQLTVNTTYIYGVEYGFHRSIIRILAGFCALIILVAFIGFALKFMPDIK